MKLRDSSMDELGDLMAVSQPEGGTHLHVLAELTRRQTVAPIEAADATKATAEHNKRNANYMLA